MHFSDNVPVNGIRKLLWLTLDNAIAALWLLWRYAYDSAQKDYSSPAHQQREGHLIMVYPAS